MLLPPAECPRRPDLDRTCEAAKPGELCEGDGECATDQAADNCGGFDVYVVRYLPAAWLGLGLGSGPTSKPKPKPNP